MPETWYLATDMQLFLVSPIFVYFIWKRKLSGLIFLATALVASTIANVVVFIVYQLPFTVKVIKRYRVCFIQGVRNSKNLRTPSKQSLEKVPKS